MDTLVGLLRGPIFRFAVALAVLGLLRHVVLSLWGVRQVLRRAGDKRLALGAVLQRTLQHLNPVKWFSGNRGVYSALSTVFHVGLILVPVFLAGHIRLWQRGVGISWPALPSAVADVLTWLAVITGVALFVGRAWYTASRGISRLQDWVLPPLIVVAFASGWLVAHPVSNPFSLQAVTLVHVGVADLLLFLTPFTKIAHCALLPFSQLVNEMAWRFVPGAGRDVVKTLGQEGKPI